MKTIILNITLTLICILSSTTAIKAVRNFKKNSKIAIEQIERVKKVLGREFELGQ